MRRLPVFPLGTVLVPGQLLPLHIFEERYRALMRDLTAPAASPGELGVVLIERGSEVGGGEVRCRIGTAARLLGHQELPDGRFVAVAGGKQRFQVVEWLPDDPYPLAMVEDLVDEDGEISGEALTATGRQVRRTLALAAELGHDVAALGYPLADDPAEALWQLCAAAPLGPFDAQRLLESRSPAVRCQMLLEGAAELASVLAFRLSGE